MGRLFASVFRAEGNQVHCSGRHTGPAPETMARNCQVVIVSVPIETTIEVIEKVGPLLGEDQCLMDLTSLKAAPVAAMLRASQAAVIGLHPLFGPGVSSISGYTICICPARGKRWLEWVKGIFTRQGAVLLETTPERHDEMMAIVQVLNHLNSITMGLALTSWGVDREEIERYATPIFKSKLGFIQEVLANHPALYAEIITHNPHLQKVLDLYKEALETICRAIESGGAARLKGLLEAQGGWYLR